MSIRAYKIKKIELEKEPTFNLWREGADEVLSLVDYGNLIDGGGYIYFDKGLINDELKEKHTPEAKRILKDILKDIGEEWGVEYSCY